MVVKDIEREDIEFITKTIGAIPVAHIDHLTPEKLGKAEVCEDVKLSDDSRILKNYWCSIQGQDCYHSLPWF